MERAFILNYSHWVDKVSVPFKGFLFIQDSPQTEMKKKLLTGWFLTTFVDG